MEVKLHASKATARQNDDGNAFNVVGSRKRGLSVKHYNLLQKEKTKISMQLLTLIVFFHLVYYP
jgi:hypothetical protein